MRPSNFGRSSGGTATPTGSASCSTGADGDSPSKPAVASASTRTTSNYDPAGERQPGELFSDGETQVAFSSTALDGIEIIARTQQSKPTSLACYRGSRAVDRARRKIGHDADD